MGRINDADSLVVKAGLSDEADNLAYQQGWDDKKTQISGNYLVFQDRSPDRDNYLTAVLFKNDLKTLPQAGNQFDKAALHYVYDRPVKGI